MGNQVSFFITLITISFIVLSSGFVFFIVIFYRTKKRQLLEQQKQKLNFIKEISKTKSEIQDQTLNHIARELHDNVGQLLAVAKIHTNALVGQNVSPKINEIDSALTQSIEEVRSISRSLNIDRINQFGFIPAIKSEIERLKKLKTFNILESIDISNQFNLNADTEIMLYRMVQEFITNTLKYAQAKNVELKLNYNENDLNILLSDDGIGFEENTVKKGSGMFNIQNRAKLIGAAIDYSSVPTKGTKLKIIYTKPTNE